MKYKDLIPTTILKLDTHADKRAYLYCGSDIFILLESNINNTGTRDIINIKSEGYRLVNVVRESEFNNRSFVWSQLVQSHDTLEKYNHYYCEIIEALFHAGEND